MAKYNATILDRCISVLTYFTFGMAGFIWILIVHFSGAKLKNFVAYHIYQSIFLGLLLTVLTIFCGYVFGFLKLIPFLGNYIAKLMWLIEAPVYSNFNYSIPFLLILAMQCYLCAGALLGKLSYVPYISNIIKSNLNWGQG